MTETTDITHTTATTGRLQIGLLVLRITTGLFFLVWSVDKLVKSEHTVAVFKKFYMMEISTQVALGLGVVQTLVVIAFMLGLFRTWTIGLLLAMHTVSVASTWAQLINPYGTTLLFWAGVPVWAGLLLLWLVRDQDTLWSLGKG
ncbi:MAG: hypothetical protein MI824_05525 [Hyphomicrobiales bacterium]|nr:hypothetical protein [Hyphomicrobiales bacterium]